MDKTEFLIIGTGIAGYEAVKQLKKLDDNAMITVVTRNKDLSKYTDRITQKAYANLPGRSEWLHSFEWMYEQNIELITGRQVNRVDFEHRKVTLDDHQTIQYQKLLIATGSRVSLAPIDNMELENVFLIKTIEDLKTIESELEKVHHVVISGASLLGLEEAVRLSEMGKKVTVIEYTDLLFSSHLDERISLLLQLDLEGRGIHFMFNRVVKRAEGDGHVERLVLDNDEVIEADAIILNKGIKPNIEFLVGTDIDYDIGIQVNSFLETNIPNVYAAGDCIEWNGLTQSLWTEAQQQGRIAAMNMTGERETFDFHQKASILEVGGLQIFSSGSFNEYDEIDEKINEQGISRIYYKDGNVSGVILYGDVSACKKYLNEEGVDQ